MNLVRSTLAAATLCIAGAPAMATNILLFDTNTNLQNAQTALNNLGLAYTVGNSTTFNGLLTGSSWDLVILDLPSTEPSSGFGDLINYIAGGGSAIMSYWNLDSQAALASAFETSVAADFFTPMDIYDWGHPIFSGVSTLTGWTNSWADDGDRLDPIGTATALGGFVPGAGTAGEAAIILGNSGRTIYNGWIFDEVTDANGIRLIENEISFLLAVPEPGTVMLLSLGLAGLAWRRKRA